MFAKNIIVQQSLEVKQYYLVKGPTEEGQNEQRRHYREREKYHAKRERDWEQRQRA